MSEIVTECVICGSPSMTRRDDPIPVASMPHKHRLPRSMPAVDLCAVHWTAYLTDWILLGWCPGGHYAEALRTCHVHRQVVPPL